MSKNTAAALLYAAERLREMSPSTPPLEAVAMALSSASDYIDDLDYEDRMGEDL